jgi:hypothetical protein
VQRKRPSSPFPSQTAKASFLAPDTLHDKWKCSSAKRWGVVNAIIIRLPTGRKNRKGGAPTYPPSFPRVLIPLLVQEGARRWSSKRSAGLLRVLRPGRADRLWPSATAVGTQLLLTLQPASAGDRVAYSGRSFLMPLPGLVPCSASFPHGFRHGPNSIAATRLASARFLTHGVL